MAPRIFLLKQAGYKGKKSNAWKQIPTSSEKKNVIGAGIMEQQEINGIEHNDDDFPLFRSREEHRNKKAERCIEMHYRKQVRWSRSLVRVLLESCRSLVRVLLESCRSLVGVLLESCWSLVRVLLVSCWSLVGVLSESCWCLVGDILESC